VKAERVPMPVLFRYMLSGLLKIISELTIAIWGLLEGSPGWVKIVLFPILVGPVLIICFVVDYFNLSSEEVL